MKTSEALFILLCIVGTIGCILGMLAFSQAVIDPVGAENSQGLFFSGLFVFLIIIAALTGVWLIVFLHEV